MAASHTTNVHIVVRTPQHSLCSPTLHPHPASCIGPKFHNLQLQYFTFDLAQPLFLSFFGSELQNDIAPSILHGLP
jgi:hypothetical protein